MKLGVVGKGGVGKTSLSGLLCQAYVARGRKVLAVDTDSNPNLAMSLGLDEETANKAPLVPRKLVVGLGDGSLSPGELLKEYGLPTPSGVTLLHAMRVDQAGAGCSCADHYMVRSLLGTAIEEEADVTLVDMEAGLEHLSRSGGTLAYADVLLMVMEPTHKSVMTAGRTVPLAKELGIPRIYGVGAADVELFHRLSEKYGVPLAAVVPWDADVPKCDRRGGPLLAGEAQPVRDAVERIIAVIENEDAERQALLAERDRIDARISELQQS
jgi:CO dehydrogenase maturation factor